MSFQLAWMSSSEISVSKRAVSVSITSTLYRGRSSFISRSRKVKGQHVTLASGRNNPNSFKSRLMEICLPSMSSFPEVLSVPQSQVYCPISDFKAFFRISMRFLPSALITAFFDGFISSPSLNHFTGASALLISHCRITSSFSTAV